MIYVGKYMSLYCILSDLKNESDVEQKFIYNFITQKEPFGLGYSSSDINTKSTLNSYLIGKGSAQKIYIPDYLIQMRGLPLIVIEAKSP